VDGVKDGILDSMGRRHIVGNTGSSPKLRGIVERLKRKRSAKKLLGKRDASICETMNTFDVNADCNMIGMFEV
jgi:hypothetical protein